MLKLYSVFLLIFTTLFCLNGQYETGRTFDFSEQTALGWDTIAGYGNPLDTTFIENETAVMVMENSVEFRVYGFKFDTPLDLSGHRYVSFKYRCKVPVIVEVTTKDTANIFGCFPMLQLIPSDTLRTSFFSFSCNSSTNFGAVDSFYFVLVNPAGTNPSDTFYLDDLALGSDVHLPLSEITGYTENFDDNSLSDSWLHHGPDTSYRLTETNQELQTVVSKNNWEGFVLNFRKLMNMSDNPNVSLRIRSKTAVPLRVYIMDYLGAYNTWNGIYQDNEWNVNVAGDNTYREYYFNFAGHFVQHFWNGMPSMLIDSTRIASIMICVNPEFPFADTLWIDDIRVGDQANTMINHAPTIDQIAGIVIDSTSELQTIQLTGLSTGDAGWDTLAITAKCVPSKYITTPQVSYIQGESNATLSFNIKRSGTTTITLTLDDNGADYTNLGSSTTQIQFEVVVNSLTKTSEIVHASAVKLYPNPVTEVLNIKTSGETIEEVKIIDQTGRIVLVQNPGSDLLKVDVQSLPNGLYLLELKSNSTVFRQRFIKE